MKQNFKIPIFIILGLIVTSLVLVFGMVWLNSVRSILGFNPIQWQPPAALAPDFSLPETALIQPMRPDRAQQFAGILERPLFSPNRQPPPVVPVEVAAQEEAPPPDPFANIQLKGVYAGTKGGGIIVQIDGVTKRIQVDESIGADWVVKSIKGRDVTLVRQNEERVLNLPHFVPNSPAVNPVAGGKFPASPVVPVASQGGDLKKNTTPEDIILERKRLRNEYRVKAGLPPIP